MIYDFQTMLRYDTVCPWCHHYTLYDSPSVYLEIFHVCVPFSSMELLHLHHTSLHTVAQK